MLQYHAPPFKLAQSASAFYIGYIIMQIPAGFILDKWPLKRVVLPAIFISSLAFVFFIYSEHFLTGFCLRLLIGMASAFSFISILYVARIYFPPPWFSTISGFTIAIGTLSASIAELVSAYLMKHHDWHVIFLSFALIGLVLGVLLLLPFKLALLEEPQKEQKQYITKVTDILFSRDIILNGSIGGLFYLPTSLFASVWGIPFLMTTYHLDKVSASLGITILFLGWAIGSPVMAILGNKSERPQKIIAVSSLTAGLFALMLVGAFNLSPLICFMLIFCLGFFSGAQVTIWRIFRFICPKDRAGFGISYTNMIILSFGALFHLVIGKRVETTSLTHHFQPDYQHGLMLLPFLFLIVFLVSISRYYKPKNTHEGH